MLASTNTRRTGGSRVIGLRRIAGLAVVIGAAGLANAAQADASCASAHSKTLASDKFARVFGNSGKVYVCVKSSGRTTLLKGARPKCQIGPNVYICDRFALGGKWVAWTAKNPSDVDVIGGRLAVMFIPTRSVNRRWYPTRQLGGEVYKIVLLADGAVAWTESVSDGGGGAFAVAVFGTDKKNHRFDRLDTCGASVETQATCYIGADTLRLVSGKTVAWKYSKDGTQKPTTTAKATLY
jgi:hypothetical protein